MENNTNRRRFNFASDILGGQILNRLKTVDQYFIIYLFCLVIAFITFTLGVEKTQMSMRRNQRELKNLKADYTAKAARLQYLSKRNEVEDRLEKHSSSLHKPVNPAKAVKLAKQHN